MPVAFLAPLLLFPMLRIHQWMVFLVFVCLGIAQTFIAFYGGYLAVLALPSGYEKRKYHRVFGGVAVALLVLTIAIGWLNDRAQFQSEQETHASRKELHEVKVRTESIADKFTVFLGAYIAPKIQALSDQPLPTKRGSERPNRPDTTTAVVSVPVAPAQVPPAPSPQAAVSTSSPQSVLRTQLRDLIYILGTTDNSIDSSIRGSRKSFFQHQPSTGPWSFVVPAADRDYFPARIASEQKTYKETLLPQIKQVRADVLAALRLSPAQLSQDEKTFQSLNAQILAPPEGPAPTSWDDPRLSNPTPRLAPMQLYLSILQLRLSAIETSPSYP